MHCNCWRWRGLAIPAGLRFVAIVVGKEFVCGIVAGPDAPIRCFADLLAEDMKKLVAGNMDEILATLRAGEGAGPRSPPVSAGTPGWSCWRGR